MKSEKLIFLDRDGIINKSAGKHKYILDWNSFEFLPGFINTFRKICKLNYKLIIVTNQQCIGKGLINETELNAIHNNMVNTLSMNQIYIQNIYYCPHLVEEKCNCRKPNVGMLIKAKKELGLKIDYNYCFLIGDRFSDISAGIAFGCKTILLNSCMRKIPRRTQPDFIITEISQLLNIFIKLEQQK